MLYVIAAAVLVGKPFYLECNYVPHIEVCVDTGSRDAATRFFSQVAVSELRHISGERGYFVRRYARARTISLDALEGRLRSVRLPAYRFSKNAPWQEFPRGTFAAPGTFTLSLYCELRWRTWQAHCEEISRNERPSDGPGWKSYPPPPDCWQPSGFDSRAIMRELGIVNEAVITGEIEP